MRLQNLVARLGRGRIEPAPPTGATPARAMPGPGTEPSPADPADRMVPAQDLVGAVDRLVEANHRHRDPEIEARLVDLRYQAAQGFDTGPGRTPWPPRYEDPFPDVIGRLPEIEPRELTGDLLGAAVSHHGCLVVRGLYGRELVDSSLDLIERVDAARAASTEVTADPSLYRPFPGASDMDRAFREMVGGQGGTWLADSPTGMAKVLDDLATVGAVAAIEQHFGQRPLISLQKSTLRRSQPIFNFAGWHQDGSFLGSDARAMNVWVALTPCGGDRPTPGIELVPRRIGELLPTDGGLGSASISDATVRAAAGDTPSIHPEFAPGDAMFFDERFVHRTHLIPDMTEIRYAIECWFFAPAYTSKSYLSFLV